jgi:hypothetical protein
MYFISREEGVIRLEGALEKTSCNIKFPWDLERNEAPLKKSEAPIK